ncbi:hypothetical protein ACI2JA_03250 [Alkalihalobacillus sp. NPDC078783]
MLTNITTKNHLKTNFLDIINKIGRVHTEANHNEVQTLVESASKAYQSYYQFVQQKFVSSSRRSSNLSKQILKNTGDFLIFDKALSVLSVVFEELMNKSWKALDSNAYKDHYKYTLTIAKITQLNDDIGRLYKDTVRELNDGVLITTEKYKQNGKLGFVPLVTFDGEEDYSYESVFGSVIEVEVHDFRELKKFYNEIGAHEFLIDEESLSILSEDGLELNTHNRSSYTFKKFIERSPLANRVLVNIDSIENIKAINMYPDLKESVDK